MTNRPRQLSDVAELSNVLRAMDEWEAAGRDLDSSHGRRCFVDDLDDEATDELAGLALTTLLRTVLEERAVLEEGAVSGGKVAAAEPCPLGAEPYRPSPQRGSRLRHGFRPVTV